MASVREVYNALKDIANKDERGFVTPTEFNSFAPIAQTNIFNSLFTQLVAAENLKRRGINPGETTLLASKSRRTYLFSRRLRMPSLELRALTSQSLMTFLESSM